MQVLYFVGVLSRILPDRVGSKGDGVSTRNAMKLNQSRIPFSFPYEQVAEKLSSLIFGGFVSVPVQVACLGCLGLCLANLESIPTRHKMDNGGNASKAPRFGSIANIVRLAFWTLGSLLRRRNRSSGAIRGLTSALGRFLCGAFLHVLNRISRWLFGVLIRTCTYMCFKASRFMPKPWNFRLCRRL